MGLVAIALTLMLAAAAPPPGSADEADVALAPGSATPGSEADEAAPGEAPAAIAEDGEDAAETAGKTMAIHKGPTEGEADDQAARGNASTEAETGAA